jgi:hypothetical protein
MGGVVDWYERHCFEVVMQRLECPAGMVESREDVCALASEGLRMLLMRKPWGFAVVGMSVNRLERNGNYMVTMLVRAWKPMYWVRAFLGKKGHR